MVFNNVVAVYGSNGELISRLNLAIYNGTLAVDTLQCFADQFRKLFSDSRNVKTGGDMDVIEMNMAGHVRGQTYYVQTTRPIIFLAIYLIEL